MSVLTPITKLLKSPMDKAIKTYDVMLISTLEYQSIGVFSYLTIPARGDWILTPDNDGSDPGIWVVEQVVLFPKSKEQEPGVCVYATPSNRRVEETRMYARIGDSKS
jgi:hypothetical protein